jgi:lysylphosphatidylglycerol synthetase-like protein (DUF2156 family)
MEQAALVAPPVRSRAPARAYSILGDEARSMGREEKWRLLSPFIRQHGREALSYATLQQGMEYFVDERGYLAFVTARHAVLARRPKRLVLCDPVCASEDAPGLLRRFLADHPRAAFGVISEACAAALRELGFRANCIGYEAELPVQGYDTRGNWKELDIVKRARNEARREGIAVREVDVATLDRAQLDAVSARWLRGKKISDREIWIYARRPVYGPEADVRKLVAFDREGRVAGFVFYDPMYREGRVVGYAANTPRTDERRFGRLTTAIHMEAMDLFRAEGKEALNLCLSPFVKLGLGRFNDDRALRAFFELTARFGGDIYNFEGLSFHKSKYRGAEKPIYFASRSRLATNEVYLGLRAAGISRGYWSTVGQLVRGTARAAWPRRPRR